MNNLVLFSSIFYVLYVIAVTASYALKDNIILDIKTKHANDTMRNNNNNNNINNTEYYVNFWITFVFVVNMWFCSFIIFDTFCYMTRNKYYPTGHHTGHPTGLNNYKKYKDSIIFCIFMYFIIFIVTFLVGILAIRYNEKNKYEFQIYFDYFIPNFAVFCLFNFSLFFLFVLVLIIPNSTISTNSTNSKKLPKTKVKPTPMTSRITTRTQRNVVVV
jgi:hypothetical protein